MTQELKERLCLAWERLNCGGWDAELLGEPPEGMEYGPDGQPRIKRRR